MILLDCVFFLLLPSISNSCQVNNFWKFVYESIKCTESEYSLIIIMHAIAVNNFWWKMMLQFIPLWWTWLFLAQLMYGSQSPLSWVVVVDSVSRPYQLGLLSWWSAEAWNLRRSGRRASHRLLNLRLLLWFYQWHIWKQ